MPMAFKSNVYTNIKTVVNPYRSGGVVVVCVFHKLVSEHSPKKTLNRYNSFFLRKSEIDDIVDYFLVSSRSEIKCKYCLTLNTLSKIHRITLPKGINTKVLFFKQIKAILQWY